MSAAAAPSAASPAVRARNLDIGYAGRAVITGMNFEVTPGQALALVGVNGSGKSTLLKTLVGLLAPLGGSLEVLGTAPRQATRRIAYLSQFHTSGFALPLRAVDVVRMGRYPERGLLGRMTREDHALVGQALETMGIAALAQEPLSSLSGGQQQRVYLAQVLCHRADLLVLDEPAAGLDVTSRELYVKALQSERARGAAVITATHDIQEALSYDQVMLLAGRVVAVGPPATVLTPEALLEAFGVVLVRTDQRLDLAVVEREHGHGHEGGDRHE